MSNEQTAIITHFMWCIFTLIRRYYKKAAFFKRQNQIHSLGIFNQISMKCIPKGSIVNGSSCIRVMILRWAIDKPLLTPILIHWHLIFGAIISVGRKMIKLFFRGKGTRRVRSFNCNDIHCDSPNDANQCEQNMHYQLWWASTRNN